MHKILIFVILNLSLFAYTLSPLKYERHLEGTSVSIEARIELINTIQWMAGAKEIKKANYEFLFPMYEYFGKYRNHEAVNFFKEIRGNGFSYDAPITIALSFDENFNYTSIEDKAIIERVGGKKNLKNLIKYIEKFAEDTDFNKFFNEKKEFYERNLDITYNFIKKSNILRKTYDFYGIPKEIDIVIANLLLGGVSPTINNKSYIIINSPDNIEDKNLENTVIHEISHSYLNPLVDKYIEDLISFKSLFEIIPNLHLLYYKDWKFTLYEQVVRASTISILNDNYSKAVKEQELIGFMYTKDFLEYFEKYKINREKYENINRFFPAIISLANEINEKIELNPFYVLREATGNLNDITMKTKNTIIISPTNEEDKEIEGKLKEYIKSIGSYFGISIVEDKEAIMQDLSKNTLIIYGTIEGNLWPKKYKETLPFKVEGEKFVVHGKTLNNGDRLIIGMVSPLSKYQSVKIYSGKKTVDIIGINNLEDKSDGIFIVK